MTKRSKEELARYYGWDADDVTVTSASGEVIDVSMPEVTDEQKAAVEAAIELAPEEVARRASPRRGGAVACGGEVAWPRPLLEIAINCTARNDR
jgi:hypothetical protein